VLGVLAAMLALAWFVHRLIERPAARLMRRALTPTIERYAIRRRPAHAVAPRVPARQRARL
jgi:peptidoglycan/LPS O-acetylase OafA/YrhL